MVKNKLGEVSIAQSSCWGKIEQNALLGGAEKSPLIIECPKTKGRRVFYTGYKFHFHC